MRVLVARYGTDLKAFRLSSGITGHASGSAFSSAQMKCG
jgi:hypothetical protein